MEFDLSAWFKRNGAVILWGVCAFALVGTPLMAWMVRAIAYMGQCTPGPDPCTRLPLGMLLRFFLALSWAFSGSLFVLILISVVATLAAFWKRKPLFGTLSFFLLPILALALPMLAVYVSRYDGCEINPDGVGNCILWGVRMGASFHTAATVQDKLYDLMPHLAGLTVMLGLLGWFFAHPSRHRRKPNEKMAMEMRRFTDLPEP